MDRSAPQRSRNHVAMVDRNGHWIGLSLTWASNAAHSSHTRVAEVRIYWGFEWVLQRVKSMNFSPCRPETSPISRNLLILQ